MPAPLLLDRRRVIAGAAALPVARALPAWAQSAAKADYSLTIAPVSLEIAPGRIIKTVGYNGSVPGPLIRVREGQNVAIDITNRSDHDEIVHWHGLAIASQADGAMEEGAPMIAPGAMQRVSFVAKPAGTRWYHTHAMAKTDLTRGLYGGQSLAAAAWAAAARRRGAVPTRPRDDTRAAGFEPREGRLQCLLRAACRARQVGAEGDEDHRARLGQMPSVPVQAQSSIGWNISSTECGFAVSPCSWV
jgi:hypothetical protein